MGVILDLVKNVAKTGPENVQRLMGALDKLPSDETLIRLAETLDKYEPYFPDLMKVIKGGGLQDLSKVMANVPDAKTLDRLIKLAPMLEKVPDKETLNRLLDRAEELQSLLKTLDIEN